MDLLCDHDDLRPDPVRHLAALGLFSRSEGLSMSATTTASSLPTRRIAPEKGLLARIGPFNFFVWLLLGLYLLPIAFMIVTALMPTDQLSDPYAPLYPAKPVTYNYQGKDYKIYNVPTADGIQHWALVNKLRTSSQFVDPQHPEAGLINWQGNWRTLTGIYEFAPTWD